MKTISVNSRESMFVKIKQLEAALSVLEMHKARSDTTNRQAINSKIAEIVKELKELDEKMITRKY